MACYTVVEEAGYEGECEVRTAFSTAEAAWRWAERFYGCKQHDEDGEIARLHVQVAKQTAPGSKTYEY